MQIDEERIENLLVNIVLKQKKKFKIQIWKDSFPCLFTWKWTK